MTRIVETVQRQGRIGVGRRRSNRNLYEPIGEAASHLRVVFNPSEPCQRHDVAHTIDRRIPDTSVGVRRGKLLNQGAMLGVVRDFRDGRCADRGIRVLPSGLWLESVEERHREPCVRSRRANYGAGNSLFREPESVNRSILE
jgi:hypothetical protein